MFCIDYLQRKHTIKINVSKDYKAKHKSSINYIRHL